LAANWIWQRLRHEDSRVQVRGSDDRPLKLPRFDSSLTFRRSADAFARNFQAAKRRSRTRWVGHRGE
jgi:hypothetical protein